MHVGIAIGAIAGIISIMALAIWFTRTRNRAQRKAISNNSTWPWDRDDQRLEGGFGHGFAFRSAWVGGNDEPKRCDVRCPPGVVDKEHVLPSSYNVPVGHSLYPTVQVPGAHGSVPDLAPDLGRRLQIANLVPGDVSSGDSSRATSRANSIVRRSSMLSRRTAQHWTPPPVDTASRPLENGYGLAIFEEKDITDLPQLPFPGQDLGQPMQPTVLSAQEGWAASLRNNVVNAVQSVLWSNPNAPDDTYTVRPTRGSRQSSLQGRAGGPSRRSSVRSKPPSRRNSTSGQLPPADPTYGADPEELADRLERAMYAVSEELEGEDTTVLRPPAALIKTRDRAAASESLSRASSVYSNASSGATRDPFASEAVPALPELPSLSRTGSDASFSQAVLGKGLSVRKSKRVSRVRGPRPALSRQSTSRSSCSVGSDMSRSSSTASGPLTENERYAQRILRERRKRVTTAKMQSVKHSLRKPSVRLGSRRKGPGSIAIRKEKLL